MSFSRPVMEQQLMGVNSELDNNRPGGVNSIVERPAQDGEVRLGFVGDGEYERYVIERDIYQIFGHSDDEEEEEMMMEVEDEDAWSDSSEDSGYESKSEHEEDSEDDDFNVIIRPVSPMNQLVPPPSFWQVLHRESSPVGLPAGAPFCFPFGVLPAQQEERSEEGQPSVCQRSEESAPSTSGLSISTKRSREEDCTEQVGVKRQRQC
ncbi:uncharacterized protein LOC141783726 [Sebastes fasciatus]|uniref:uncharacterized protein LOC141783726 n=1 Tax=Sebastes fasciatus TaxID=394691 RepID=UPI003D9E3F62